MASGLDDWTAEDVQRPIVKAFFDMKTSSVQYVVWDRTTRQCAIIDPVLDFDEKSATTATHTADEILHYIASENNRRAI